MQTRTNNTPCVSYIDGLFHNRAGERKHIYFLQYLSTILTGISKKDVKKKKGEQLSQNQIKPWHSFYI